MVRQGNNFLQVCKQIGALTNIDNPDGDVTVLREAMGVLQVFLFLPYHRNLRRGSYLVFRPKTTS